MRIALVVIGSLMIVLTLLPLARSSAWWIRIWDFPRIQVAFLLVAVLGLFALFEYEGEESDYIFAGGLTIALLFQCAKMFPYTRLKGKQVEPARNGHDRADLKLIFGNVLMTNRDSEGLRDLIRGEDPDIFLAVEADDWWREQLAEFERTHMHTILQPQSNTYGMLLYSRLELIDPRVEFLIQRDVPSIHARVRLRSGGEVEIHCLHPRPPFPTEDESSAERDAELILVGKEVKGKDSPIVVFGDLNDVAWSRTTKLFQKISGLLDPRIGRGFFNTFHARYPFIRFPLDHFFHSKHFRLVEFKRLPYVGSDHFPVLIALSLEADAPLSQSEPHPDADERREADDKIEEAASRES